MMPYWLLFLWPAVATIVSRPSSSGITKVNASWIAFGIGLALMIGFRYEVGGDWLNYERILSTIAGASFWEAMEKTDPAYGFLNWFFQKTWIVNLFCGAAFSCGLIVFCLRQPHAWLALLIAIPYLVVVVAFGYSRQAVAISFAMLALVAVQHRLVIRFLAWIACAAMFHKTAILLLPIGLLANTRNRWVMLLIGGIAGYVLYALLLQSDVDGMIDNYIEADFSSDGAAIRVTMNAIPSALFLLWRKKFAMTESEMRLWIYMAICGLAFCVLLLISPSSTAVDRMALYFIPLQVFVFSRLPAALSANSQERTFLILGLIAYSAAVLFVWLNYSDYAKYWIPYNVYSISDL